MLFSLYLQMLMRKRGEKIVTTKYTTDIIQGNDRNLDGDDGDKNIVVKNKYSVVKGGNISVVPTARPAQHPKQFGSSGQKKSTTASMVKHETDIAEVDDITISTPEQAK